MIWFPIAFYPRRTNDSRSDLDSATKLGDSFAMQILRTQRQLEWGELDVPLFGLDRDWNGEAVDPAAGWCLVQDKVALWLIASRQASAVVHPDAIPGEFREELWRWDVAELFIAARDRSRYLELNLAPQGAWWACLFEGPRVASEVPLAESSGIETFADPDSSFSWTAAARIPLEFLREQLNFNDRSPVNITFIIDSPQQKFLSSADLGPGEPDFHRPQAFQVPRWIEIDVPAS